MRGRSTGCGCQCSEDAPRAAGGIKQQLHPLFSLSRMRRVILLFLLGSFHLIVCFTQQPGSSLQRDHLFSTDPVGKGERDLYAALFGLTDKPGIAPPARIMG